MIEAVNASIANAQVLRSVSEEASTSQAANPVRVQKAAVVAPYLSPHVKLTPDAKPIFVVRDMATGAQIKQFPTEAQIRAYQKASAAKPVIQSSGTEGEQQQVTAEQAKIMIKSSVQYKEERAAVRYDSEASVPGQTSGTSSSEFQPAAAQASVDQQA